MVIRIPCYLIGVSLTIATAQCEELVHPYLQRPLFTISVRSGELLEKLMQDVDVRGFRLAFGNGLLKCLADRSSHGMPLDYSYSRTWLACPKFGWEQGGHIVDVLTVNGADYQNRLRKGGLTIRQVKESPLWAHSKGVEFFLPLDDTVASIYMPTGGAFRARDLEKCLQSQIATHRAALTSENPGLFLSVNPRNLVPADVARAINTGLSVKRQRIDGESDATFRFRAGRISAVQDWMKLALEDVETVSLSADILESDRFSVTLKLHPMPRSDLASRISELSAHRIIPQISWPEPLCPNAVAVFSLPRTLSRALLNGENESNERIVESMVVFECGIDSKSSYWIGFDPGWGADVGWPGTDFLTTARFQAKTSLCTGILVRREVEVVFLWSVLGA